MADTPTAAVSTRPLAGAARPTAGRGVRVGQDVPAVVGVAGPEPRVNPNLGMFRI